MIYLLGCNTFNTFGLGINQLNLSFNSRIIVKNTVNKKESQATFITIEHVGHNYYYYFANRHFNAINQLNLSFNN